MSQDDERQDVDKAESLAASTANRPSEEQDDIDKADRVAARKESREREADAHEARSEVA